MEQLISNVVFGRTAQKENKKNETYWKLENLAWLKAIQSWSSSNQLTSSYLQ